MTTAVESRLRALEHTGACRWLRGASDCDLRREYSAADAFTYLSLYEGFGYPPFEAAFAGCPMVLSRDSSVGEIWSRYARCVDPNDIGEIVCAWRWALGLGTEEREAVAAAQRARAKEFSWSRALGEYIALWQDVASELVRD